jgi:hypothetical protein
VYEIKVEVFPSTQLFSYFLLLFFIHYMFRSCDHLQVYINTLETNITDHGIHCSFGVLVNVVDKGYRFQVSVDAVAVVELNIAWRGLILALRMVLVWVAS